MQQTFLHAPPVALGWQRKREGLPPAHIIQRRRKAPRTQMQYSIEESFFHWKTHGHPEGIMQRWQVYEAMFDLHSVRRAGRPVARDLSVEFAALMTLHDAGLQRFAQEYAWDETKVTLFHADQLRRHYCCKQAREHRERRRLGWRPNPRSTGSTGALAPALSLSGVVHWIPIEQVD